MDSPLESFVMAVVAGLVLGLAIVFLLRSIDSRKWFVCPQCGERLRVELIEAGHCNTCGAELKQERGFVPKLPFEGTR